MGAECVETCLVEAVEAAIIPEESVTTRNSNRYIPLQIALLKKVGRVGYYIGSENIS